MTERIEMLKRFQWDKRHHVYRRAAEENAERAWRDPALSDAMRTAIRLKCALDAETPVLLPGELIAFTRTVPEPAAAVLRRGMGGHLRRAHHPRAGQCEQSLAGLRVRDVGRA